MPVLRVSVKVFGETGEFCLYFICFCSWRPEPPCAVEKFPQVQKGYTVPEAYGVSLFWSSEATPVELGGVSWERSRTLTYPGGIDGEGDRFLVPLDAVDGQLPWGGRGGEYGGGHEKEGDVLNVVHVDMGKERKPDKTEQSIVREHLIQ